jgi:hypothetical protein
LCIAISGQDTESKKNPVGFLANGIFYFKRYFL